MTDWPPDVPYHRQRSVELSEGRPSRQLSTFSASLSALDVPDDVAKPLMDLARAANVHYKSWRAYAEVGLWRKQEELKALVAASATIRYFLPAAPSGMLQTPEYATQVLTPTVRGRAARNIERTVEARLRRQEALRDESRTFMFVMTEQAVRWQCAAAEVMAAQCAHMAAVAEQPNATVGIIPNCSGAGDSAKHIRHI